MPHPGQMLGDRYRLDDRIAAGGMGEVWQATDTVLGRDVAVKTLQADRAGDSGFQTRFRHEARAMAALHHPGVADVYDYGQAGDGADAYIVMARVQGVALSQFIAERGRLSPVETMSIVAQAGRALDAAHQAGIVHRDVKPANLIVRPDGTVVLVDFGVARSAESAALTGAKEVVGTALYIAPEQISKQTTGPAADVYALGAVAYHCLAGRPPFVGDNPIAVAMQHLQDEPPELPADVPGPVRDLVATAMAKDPAHRYSSAAAMADAADAARHLLDGPLDSTAALTMPPGAFRPAAGGAAVGGAVAGAAVPSFRRGTSPVPGAGTPVTPTAVDMPAVSAAGGTATAPISPAVSGPRDGSGSMPPVGLAGPVPPAPPASRPTGPTGPTGPAGPGAPGSRRPLWFILAGVVVALAAAGIALAATLHGNGTGNSPDPASSIPAVATSSTTKSASAAPERTNSRSHATTKPTSSPRTSSNGGGTGTGTGATTAPTSNSPTTAPTTTKATPTGTTTTTAGGDDEGGGDDNGGGGGGAATTDAAVAVTPAN